MWKPYVFNKWEKFWRLTLLWETRYDKNKNIEEKCICECWKEIRVSHHALVTAHTKSCWCLLSDVTREKQKKYCNKHWLRSWKNRFSRIYQWIRRRCKNQNDAAYPQYWWRWIQVKRNNIEEFYNDMYKSYIEHVNIYWEKDTTIERIDTNWNYCKENCRRATMKEQQNNRTNNSYIEIEWKKYWIQEFANKYNIKYSTAKYRIRMYKKWIMSYESLTHHWTIYNLSLDKKENIDEQTWGSVQ